MVKYAPGNTYGPYNFLLLRRSDRVNCAGKHLWGIYQCNCDKHTEFEALNRNVENGHCHGCPECSKLFKQEVARNNRKYLPGQYIGPNNILFIKELEPHGGRRRGLFECPQCGNKKWETSLESILGGACHCNNCHQKMLSDRIIQYNKSLTRDLTGQTFNKLTVVKLDKEKTVKKGEDVWECLCNCGNPTPVYVTTNDLTRKDHPTKSCGCERKLVNAIDLTGKKFGHLTALYPTDERVFGCLVWMCICDCGNYHKVSSDCLLRGKTMSCGCIGSSRGEDVLKQLLTSLNIKFFQEQQFNDCINDKTRRQLRFDFYLPEYNICIEYDGQQHYKDIKGWADTLEDIQYRDAIKNQYCKKHNMSLIRIPYWDYDRLNVQYLMSLIESHQGSEVDGFTEPNQQSC